MQIYIALGRLLRSLRSLGFAWANLLQAAAFGVWHYHGVPSGLLGVALTFVFGLLMGWLVDACGGLAVPWREQGCGPLKSAFLATP